MYRSHANGVWHSTTHRGANGKHRRDMPSVCDLLYECGYSNSMSGNALACDFNLLSLQRMFLCSSRRHWYYNRLMHKFSQSKYSAEEGTVGIEVSSPTNWLPLPSSSRGRKRGGKMGKDWTWHVQWVSVMTCHICAHIYWRWEKLTDVVQRE